MKTTKTYYVWILGVRLSRSCHPSLDDARTAVREMAPNPYGSGSAARFFRVPERRAPYIESFAFGGHTASQAEDGYISAWIDEEIERD